MDNEQKGFKKMSSVKSLVAKLAEATIAVGNFVADKFNKDGEYKYISADLVLERAGEALAKAGVAVVPGIVSQTIAPYEHTNRFGQTSMRYDATVTFSMLVTDGESEIVQPWVGCGVDFGKPDKALYKAVTSGHKYFLMKLLNISIGNTDSEHEGAEAEGAVATRQTTTTKASAPTVGAGKPTLVQQLEKQAAGNAPGMTLAVAKSTVVGEKPVDKYETDEIIALIDAAKGKPMSQAQKLKMAALETVLADRMKNIESAEESLALESN